MFYFENMNILLIEDEKPLALALSEILRQNKYQVETVFDGLSGYDFAICGSFGYNASKNEWNRSSKKN